MNDLHRAVLAALDLEQQQLCRCGWSVCADTTARAQKLIDLRRDIAGRHALLAEPGLGYRRVGGYGDIEPACAACGTPDEYATYWPCADYLAAARATLPADHPALTA